MQLHQFFQPSHGLRSPRIARDGKVSSWSVRSLQSVGTSRPSGRAMGSCFLVLGRAFARRKTQSRCKGGGKEAESVPEERQSTQSTVVNDLVEVPQDVGFPLPGVFEGLPPPSLANGWTLLGDLAACIFAAPFLAILSRLAGALKPEWFMHSENNGNAFIFPEASHGVMFWLCWCIGGLVMRAFEADAVDSQDLVKTVKRTALAAETSGFLANLVWLFLRFSGNLESAYTMTGYSAPPHAIPTYADFFIDLQFQVLLLVIWRFTVAVLFAERPVPEREEVNVDTRLLVGDLLAIGLITPAVIIEVYFKTKKYTPLWTDFWDVTDYGIGKPILAHGFVLALCWLVGAFVAGAYSKDATAPIDQSVLLKRLWTAGVLATVLLFLCNVLSMTLLESPQVLTAFDPALQKRLFDFANDVLFAALCLTPWRLYFGGYI